LLSEYRPDVQWCCQREHKTTEKYCRRRELKLPVLAIIHIRGCKFDKEKYSKNHIYSRKNNQKKTKRKGKSVQDLLGIKTFTKNGLKVGKEEFIFYMVQPTNISVLSHTNIEIKVRHLMMVLSAVPDIEITCTDSCECFDTNKSYIKGRIEAEQNEKVRKILNKDLDFLDSIQTETSTARQFLFIARCKSSKSENVLQKANRGEKIISDQGFEVTRMKKADIKRFLAIYFDASMNGDLIPDYDGEQYISEAENEEA
jgi:hypothetical protein